MSVGPRVRLEALHGIKQRRALTGEEKALLRLHQDTLVVRAQAAVLLKQRGYDVPNPEQFAPLG